MHIVLEEVKRVSANRNNIPRTIFAKFLGYKEKEGITEEIKLCYKLKDTGYSVREHFCKEIVEIRKRLMDQVKKLREHENYQIR